MSEKVTKLGLERDYKKYLYFIDGAGNVCRRTKHGENTASETIHPNACVRDNEYLYFIDKDGDVSRSPRAIPGKKKDEGTTSAEGG